jgi:hypothetical protein
MRARLQVVFTSSLPVTVAAGHDRAYRVGQARLRLTARGAQPVAIFGIKLRESDGGPFFHKLVQTNASRTRKCLEPLMFGIR